MINYLHMLHYFINKSEQQIISKKYKILERFDNKSVV